MLDATLERCTHTGSESFVASSADTRRAPHRCWPTGKKDVGRALVEAVDRALCNTGYSALRGVQIEIERGIVVLWGRVPTYHQKQVAQATAQQVDGVRGVANGIEVVCRR